MEPRQWASSSSYWVQPNYKQRPRNRNVPPSTYQEDRTYAYFVPFLVSSWSRNKIQTESTTDGSLELYLAQLTHFPFLDWKKGGALIPAENYTNPNTILGIFLLVAPVRAGCRDPAWGGEGPGREGGEHREQPGEARGVSQAQVQEAGLQLQVRVQGRVHWEERLQDHLPIQVPGIQETGRDLESVCLYFLTFSPCQFQECRNVWQNQCRGKNGRRRGKRSPRRQPYWLDKNNIEVIYNAQDFPIGPSDLPFADQGADAGSTYTFASPPKSRSCWKKVRKCEWKTYRTSCGNRPTTTCSGKTIQDCKKRCKNRWYCDTCPAGTGGGATTAKPVGPGQTTPRPRPTTPRPTPRPPGPPAPPPPGTFIIGPPGTPVGADTGISVIDARSGRGRKNRRPWWGPWTQYLLVAIPCLWTWGRQVITSKYLTWQKAKWLSEKIHLRTIELPEIVRYKIA